MENEDVDYNVLSLFSFGDFWTTSRVRDLEDQLERERVRASSPPAEGFATSREFAAWRSVELAMHRRKQRCVASKLGAFGGYFRSSIAPRLEAMFAREGFVVDFADDYRVTPDRTAYYFISVEFEIRMEMRKAKSIAEHMAVWRARARRRTNSDVVKGVSTMVEATAGATVALPVATGSTDDDATPAEQAEERGIPTTVGGGGTDQHLQPVVKDGDGIDNSSEEIGTVSVPLDLGICDGVVLLMEPASGMMCGSSVGNGEDSGSDGSSGNDNSGGGHGGDNGETFVSCDEERKCPSDGWKRSPRSAGTGGNAVLGVARPFDRGKNLGVRTVDGAGKGFRCWIGGFGTEHPH